MNIEQIETAVSSLTPEELARFSQWFEEYISDQWDKQIEADALAGRLDAAMARAEEHHKAGRCTPL